MNYIEKQKEYKRIMSMLKHTSISGNREGCFRSYFSESQNHIRLKFELWLKLKKAGHKVWTEVIFISGIRMDILSYHDGIFRNFEILVNESTEKFLSKCETYPEIDIVPIKTMKEIEEMII